MHRATQPFRWAALAATLVLAMGMAIVWSPAARAATCVDGGTLTVDLGGSDATLTLDLEAGDDPGDYEIAFTGASCDDVDLDEESVDTIEIFGDDDSAETVTFAEGSDDPWSWTGQFTITVDLGANDDPDDDDSVVLEGTAGADTIDADALATYTDVESLVVHGGAMADTITGADAIKNDINGEAGNDTIDGGSLADEIRGKEGNDHVDGNGGDDVFYEETAANGNDAIDGGTGVDTLDYSGRSNTVSVELGEDPDPATTDNGESTEHDSIHEIENVLTGTGDDEIHGNNESNVLNPGSGTEEEISGGGGADTLDYSDNGAAMSIDLATGASPAQSAVEDTNDDGDFVGGADKEDDISGFEDVVGSDDDDEISGSGIANVIEGGPGADTVDGRGGNDRFVEGSDDDGALYKDVILGGSGVDTVDYSGREATCVFATITTPRCVVIDLSDEYEESSPNDWEDDFEDADVENVYGSPADDYVSGSDGANAFWLGEGDDNAWGEGGADRLFGEAGEDALSGGDGKDRLVGGDDEDNLFGDDGDDNLSGSRDGFDDLYNGGSQNKGDVCSFESYDEFENAVDANSNIGYADCEKGFSKKYRTTYGPPPES